MIYNDFKGLSLSRLGFGAMRFPTKEDGLIDEKEAEKLIDKAIKGGINYFDTGYSYHGGESEVVLGRILKKYPRNSFFLATKYPGHERLTDYNPAIIFEKQLKKCGVDYFDFYLLHNVCEDCLHIYENDKYGIVEYFKKQKELGRIKHLGFSSHAFPDNLDKFLSVYHNELEFCQIQLNYLDWTLQDAKKKVEILDKYNIPIWVMEPNRGGKLSRLNEELLNEYKKVRPNDSSTAWSFNWLKNIKSVKMILSGMSTLEQVEDNLNTFSYEDGLSEKECELVFEIAEKLKASVPCTACKYCIKGCPKGLNIPELIKLYNDTKVTNHQNSYAVGMYLETVDESKWPHNCIACGACAKTCPQKIDIPKVLKDFSLMLKKNQRWQEICDERKVSTKKFEGD